MRNQGNALLSPSMAAKLRIYLDKDKPPVTRAISASYSDWLDLTPWSFFCTFTTPYEMTLAGARRLMTNYHRKLKENGLYATFFWVAEKFEIKDGYHTHGLLSLNGNDLSYMDIAQKIAFECWQKVSVFKGQESKREDGLVINRCDIQRINPKKHGTRYLCKYVSKKHADWDIIY